MPRTGYQAYVEGMRKMHAGYTFPAGSCLKQQRILWDVAAYDFTPANGRDPWAIEAFDFAQFKHPTSNPLALPDYVPCYWRKAGRPGHIALALKHGSGVCLTTDRPNGGRFGIVPIDEISRAWGMELVGWAEDLNKVRIWTPPEPARTVPKVATPSVRSRYEAIDKLASGIYHDTTDGSPNHETAWKIHRLASARY